jgi:hypothetical protein
VRIGAVALGLVVDPLAFVNISVSVHQLALSIGFIVLPLTFVAGAIGPQLGALAVAHCIEPLPGVDCTVFESEWALGNPTILVRLLINIVVFNVPASCLHHLLLS